MNRDKKSAMELSLNLIILMVIGGLVLGTIVFFVQGSFGGSEDSFRKFSDEQSQKELEAFEKNCNENLCFDKGLVLNLKSGEDTKTFLSVKNVFGGNDDFPGGNILDDSSGFITEYVVDIKGDVSSDTTITINCPPIPMKENKKYARVCSINFDAPKGTYYLTLNLNDEHSGDLIYQDIKTVNIE